MQQTTDVVTLEEVWRLFKETDARLDKRSQETDRKFQDTDRQFKEINAEFKERFKETERLIKETRKAIGKLGNRLGQFVEEMVRPAAVRIFQERGIEVHEVYRDVVSKRDGEVMEIDLLVVNDTNAVAIECKSKLTAEDVDDHLERLVKFKRLFPKYKDMNIMGAVAGMVVPDSVTSYAIKKGFFVLCQSGETVIIKNDTTFQPASW